jgi:cytochrome P450
MAAGVSYRAGGGRENMIATLFSDETRRDPYRVYQQLRESSPLLQAPGGLWFAFDYEGVNRVLSDHEAFSSRSGPADWMIFQDPPRHTQLRALVAKAFTPRSIANLEPRIRELSRGLLDHVVRRGEMDVAEDFAVPLPMLVIGEMLGIPPEDRERFKRWNDALVAVSYVFGGDPEAARAVMAEFRAVTGEMGEYLGALLARRREDPRDDLISRLAAAEVDGERLTHPDILGFFQLLLLAGSETTTNLINNAVLCFVAHRDQLERIVRDRDLLTSAVEEVLRFRSPLQWMFRVARRDIAIHRQTIPAGSTVLAMIGSANHDPAVFTEPGRFDVAREPNPHLAFGHGVHFCMGAPLARLEGRIALGDLLDRVKDIGLVGDGKWEPRKGLHVHGPTRLPIRFRGA